MPEPVGQPVAQTPSTGGIQGALTRQIGPLKAWQWGLAIGGGYLLYRVITGRGLFSGSSSGTVVGDAAAAGDSGVVPGIGSIPPLPDPTSILPTSNGGGGQAQADPSTIINNITNPPPVTSSSPISLLPPPPSSTPTGAHSTASGGMTSTTTTSQTASQVKATTDALFGAGSVVGTEANRLSVQQIAKNPALVTAMQPVGIEKNRTVKQAAGDYASMQTVAQLQKQTAGAYATAKRQGTKAAPILTTTTPVGIEKNRAIAKNNAKPGAINPPKPTVNQRTVGVRAV